MAQDPKFESVHFVSICCDKLDGARYMIDEEADPRWQNINHYFMEEPDKEEAKRVLDFQTVPFYVVLDQHGSIQQMGNIHLISFQKVAELTSAVVSPQVSASLLQLDGACTQPVQPDRVFCLDEDF